MKSEQKIQAVKKRISLSIEVTEEEDSRSEILAGFENVEKRIPPSSKAASDVEETGSYCRSIEDSNKMGLSGCIEATSGDLTENISSPRKDFLGRPLRKRG